MKFITFSIQWNGGDPNSVHAFIQTKIDEGYAIYSITNFTNWYYITCVK